MPVVLITGVAGFIGRYVAHHFAQHGWRVIGIDRVQPENAPGAVLTHYASIDLPDAALRPLLRQYTPELCIHCAGRASIGFSLQDPASDFSFGPALTFDLLNTLRLEAPRCRFVFVSSAAVYGAPSRLPVTEQDNIAPISPYGYHKWQCEILCQEFTAIFNVPTASVRIFSAYGPGLRRQVLWDICHKILVQKTLVLQGTGRESRDFVHVSDIAQALFIVGTGAAMRGEVYNLGSGREITIAALAALLCQELGFTGRKEFDGILPQGTPENWQADIAKLGLLGFTPSISLERGVASFAAWCRAELAGYDVV